MFVYTSSLILLVYFISDFVVDCNGKLDKLQSRIHGYISCHVCALYALDFIFVIKDAFPETEQCTHAHSLVQCWTVTLTEC